MRKLGLRSIDLFAALALVAGAGCGSRSLTPSDGGGGGVDHPVTTTSNCKCQADDQALTISWQCYCQLYSCDDIETISSCASTIGVWTHGCLFDQYTVNTAGGPEIWVYDQTGKLVGAQLATDDSVFVCPDNPAIQRYTLRAGQFRPDTCDGVTTCDCADTDASAQTSCATGDGGIRPL